MRVEFEKEVDGRWIAEIPALPGVLAYGSTKMEALNKVRVVALRTLADAAEHGKTPRAVKQLFSNGVARG
jgi:predicted RNase H-like HicB family nuclease